tara:strand:- start:8642 stop:8953 length:312 start_codon:yes stop_codon:yes gene_type:complete
MRTPKTLAVGNTSQVTQLYTAENETVTPNLVITNNTNNIVDVTIHVTDATTNHLFEVAKLPAGIGKNITFPKLMTQRLASGYGLRLGVSDNVNFFLSGTVTSE